MSELKAKFDPEEFVEKQVEQIRNVLGSERALIAVSGGVDSCTCAALVHGAIGNNLLCAMLDDAFMRIGEPERVAALLSQPPLSLPIKILNVQERFLEEMRELRDAEEKRKVFRETFYRVLSEAAQREGISYLVQGTILADIIETAGGVKTQHNVLSQIGINPRERYGFLIVEPLATLFKGQVRDVARFLGLPREIAERQPFPGPGLSVRVVGEIRRDKLDAVKVATAIAEEKLAPYAPSQYFAVILDNVEDASHDSQLLQMQGQAAEFFKVPKGQVQVTVFEDKATGLRDGNRVYGEVATVKVLDAGGSIHQSPVSNLNELQNIILTNNVSFTRFFYLIREKPKKQPYAIAVRAISTTDFLTAKVSDIAWETLDDIAENILRACSNVSAVYYDVTPKPPATVEME
ncbi:MAG TPA: ATP-binding protein [Candidatus Bathyarchaeia archaeon]|nr:ATP-binding protein [Candidatus Bathyarchaeia archaeon]